MSESSIHNFPDLNPDLLAHLHETGKISLFDYEFARISKLSKSQVVDLLSELSSQGKAEFTSRMGKNSKFRIGLEDLWEHFVKDKAKPETVKIFEDMLGLEHSTTSLDETVNAEIKKKVQKPRLKGRKYTSETYNPSKFLDLCSIGYLFNMPSEDVQAKLAHPSEFTVTAYRTPTFNSLWLFSAKELDKIAKLLTGKEHSEEQLLGLENKLKEYVNEKYPELLAKDKRRVLPKSNVLKSQYDPRRFFTPELLGSIFGISSADVISMLTESENYVTSFYTLKDPSKHLFSIRDISDISDILLERKTDDKRVRAIKQRINAAVAQENPELFKRSNSRKIDARNNKFYSASEMGLAFGKSIEYMEKCFDLLELVGLRSYILDKNDEKLYSVNDLGIIATHIRGKVPNKRGLEGLKEKLKNPPKTPKKQRAPKLKTRRVVTENYNPEMHVSHCDIANLFGVTPEYVQKKLTPYEEKTVSAFKTRTSPKTWLYLSADLGKIESILTGKAVDDSNIPELLRQLHQYNKRKYPELYVESNKKKTKQKKRAVHLKPKAEEITATVRDVSIPNTTYNVYHLPKRWSPRDYLSTEAITYIVGADSLSEVRSRLNALSDLGKIIGYKDGSGELYFRKSSMDTIFQGLFQQSIPHKIRDVLTQRHREYIENNYPEFASVKVEDVANKTFIPWLKSVCGETCPEVKRAYTRADYDDISFTRISDFFNPTDYLDVPALSYAFDRCEVEVIDRMVKLSKNGIKASSPEKMTFLLFSRDQLGKIAKEFGDIDTPVLDLEKKVDAYLRREFPESFIGEEIKEFYGTIPKNAKLTSGFGFEPTIVIYD